MAPSIVNRAIDRTLLDASEDEELLISFELSFDEELLIPFELVLEIEDGAGPGEGLLDPPPPPPQAERSKAKGKTIP